MLIGEPGVGKTAIVEGLAHRLEFEQETVPPRLRDCQVISLQMNTIVAGTICAARRLYRSSLQKDSAVSASDERRYVSKNTG